MAPKDDSRPPLFNDTNDQLNNPHVLQKAEDKTIVAYVKRQGGAGKVIRRLAKDVSDRDAEISRLRRKVEEFGTLFKDHLMAVHDMSRLDADRAVRDSPVFTKTATDNLQEDLDLASSENSFADNRPAPSNETLTSATRSQTSILSSVRDSADATRSSNSSTIRAVRNPTTLRTDT